MEKTFYKAFEDKYRGSRELITERLKFYLQFVKVLDQIYENIEILDLGCGRGEWLEILKNENISAVGIDLDEEMVKESKSRGLNVYYEDAVEYLKKMKAESKHVISAFHLVEHLSSENLELLIKECYRILKPCGILILETPNPENLRVGSCDFYLDPTHIKPIPPLQLSFYAEYHKFIKNKIIGLHENNAFYDNKNISILDVLYGTSPDYALVSLKNGADQNIRLFDKLFNQNYGINIEYLTLAYEEKLNERFTILNERLSENQNCMNQLRLKIEEVKNELELIYSSKSWRITAPLRLIKTRFNKIFNVMK